MFSETVLSILTSHLGNRRSRQVWEEGRREVGDERPKPTDPRRVKEAFIHRKYMDRSWIQWPTAMPPLEAGKDGEDMKGILLVHGILREDGPVVMRAVALGADPSGWRDIQKLEEGMTRLAQNTPGVEGKEEERVRGEVRELGKRWLYASPLSLAVFHTIHSQSRSFWMPELLLLLGAHPNVEEPLSQLPLMGLLEREEEKQSEIKHFLHYLTHRKR